MNLRIEVAIREYRIFKATVELLRVTIDDKSELFHWVAPEVVFRLDWMYGIINSGEGVNTIKFNPPPKPDRYTSLYWNCHRFLNQVDLRTLDAMVNLYQAGEGLHAEIFNKWDAEFLSQIKSVIDLLVKNEVAVWA